MGLGPTILLVVYHDTSKLNIIVSVLYLLLEMYLLINYTICSASLVSEGIVVVMCKGWANPWGSRVRVRRVRVRVRIL